MGQKDQLDAALNLLGGPSVLGCEPKGPIEVHLMLVEGLPVEALTHLLDSLKATAPSDLLGTVISISRPAIMRRRKEGKRLSVSQSESVWKFATILGQASRVFANQEQAERWLFGTTIGLDQHRPIDLLATGTGTEIVAQFLAGIDLGVYT